MSRKSELGKMYDLRQSNAHLDKIVFSIISEVKFNIETGAILPFNIIEKLPSLSEDELDYIDGQLHLNGIVISLEFMKVLELL